MPAIETQVVDESARVVLPESFAKSTVAVMRVSEDEIRIVRRNNPADAEVVFEEEVVRVMSDRDRDLLLELLENPPPPTQALIEAFEKYGRRDG